MSGIVLDDVAASLSDQIGAAARYTWGNCTRLVAELATWVPAGWGDAKDWLANAEHQGFAISGTPVPGSVVVYGAGNGYSQFGHVALVTGVNSGGTFNVIEENVQGLGKISPRTSSLADVQGFILPPAGRGGIDPSGLPSLVPGLSDLLKNLPSMPGLPSLPGAPSIPNPFDAVGQGLSKIGQGIANVPVSIGHGIAGFLTAEKNNVGAFAVNQLPALAVSAVVLLVLFGDGGEQR